MPDDEDYAELGRLIANPQTWTGAQTATMQTLLRQQLAQLAAVHPSDASSRANLRALVDQISAAIQVAGSTDREHPGLKAFDKPI